MTWRAPIAMLVLLVGCSPTPQPKQASPSSGTGPAATNPAKPRVDAALYRLTLPEAVTSFNEPPPDAPNIVSSGDGLWVGERPAGNLRELLEANRLKRIDPLFAILKEQREAWKASHPGAAYCGCAVLWFDRSTPLVLFKSVFQTAAFTGHPNLVLAVTPRGGSPGAVGYLNFDARVPYPGAPEGEPVALHVEYVESGQIHLAWKVRTRVESTSKIDDETSPIEKRLTLLSQVMEAEWKQYGGHQLAEDREVDQAVLHIANRFDLMTAVQLLDAMYAPKRDYLVGGQRIAIPAFNVTFAIN